MKLRDFLEAQVKLGAQLARAQGNEREAQSWEHWFAQGPSSAPAIDFAEAAAPTLAIDALKHIAGLPAVTEEQTRANIAAAYDEARNAALEALTDLHAEGCAAATAALTELADEAGSPRPEARG
jgi:hypothetical protein